MPQTFTESEADANWKGLRKRTLAEIHKRIVAGGSNSAPMGLPEIQTVTPTTSLLVEQLETFYKALENPMVVGVDDVPVYAKAFGVE